MLKHLSKENFFQYGIFIQSPSNVAVDKNIDSSKYWHNLFKDELGSDNITTGILSIFNQPYVVEELERHQRYGEIFVAINGDSILTVALPDAIDSGEVDESKVAYFLLNAGNAVLLKKGVWHKPPVPIKSVVDFLMILPEDILNDIDKVKLNEILLIPEQ